MIGKTLSEKGDYGTVTWRPDPRIRRQLQAASQPQEPVHVDASFLVLLHRVDELLGNVTQVAGHPNFDQAVMTATEELRTLSSKVLRMAARKRK